VVSLQLWLVYSRGYMDGRVWPSRLRELAIWVAISCIIFLLGGSPRFVSATEYELFLLLWVQYLLITILGLPWALTDPSVELRFIEYYRVCDHVTALHAAGRLLHDLVYPSRNGLGQLAFCLMVSGHVTHHRPLDCIGMRCQRQSTLRLLA
jgi:hypothetical protein